MSFNPYVAAHPGDLITAQAWNELQVDVQQDIAAKVDAAKQDLRKNGVDKATDAAEFSGKTPEEWETATRPALRAQGARSPGNHSLATVYQAVHARRQRGAAHARPGPLSDRRRIHAAPGGDAGRPEVRQVQDPVLRQSR